MSSLCLVKRFLPAITLLAQAIAGDLRRLGQALGVIQQSRHQRLFKSFGDRLCDCVS